MKFGIGIPNSVEEAKELDLKNGNTHWADAIQKELKNKNVTFDLVSEDEKVPVGYKQISCHLIFDVKFDLTRKARYVAGGHMTDPLHPSHMQASSVEKVLELPSWLLLLMGLRCWPETFRMHI